MDMHGNVFIGTSGWNYKHWANGVFYPPDIKPAGWLAYYCQVFPTVEVNNTFYRLPERSVFEKWREFTPPDFRFSLKVSRFFTHMKHLQDPQIHAARFLNNASGLGDKMAVILFQLPAGWSFRPDRLQNLLNYLSKQKIAPGIRSAFEFRDPSWYVDLCFSILRQHHAALVLADWPGFSGQGPLTSNYVYIRRHGPAQLYSSTYSEELLIRDAERVHSWRRQGMDVFEYFNNDLGGYAVQNAQELMRLIASSAGTVQS